MKKQEHSYYEVRHHSDRETKTRKNEELQNEIHLQINRGSFLKAGKTGIFTRTAKHIRNLGCLVIFTGIAVAFSSCAGGYIVSEPSRQEYARPYRPSETHIWISGDWTWNSHSHGYVQQSGYWIEPRQGQTYVEGSWQTTPRGKSWNKGHWQKNSHQNYNHHDNYIR